MIVNSYLQPHLLRANPPYADPARNAHDKVIVCVSGGKDSILALLSALVLYGPERVIAHHCIVEEDWEHTTDYIQALCSRLGVPLYMSQAHYYGYECLACGHHYLRQAALQVCTKCRSTNGRQLAVVRNLLDLVEWRQKWPDMRVRFCTDYLKITVLDLWYDDNKAWLGEHPVVVLGERWAESAGRAELPEVRARPSRKGLVEFRPILALRRIEVFNAVREAGIALHPCYDLQWRALLREEHRRWREQGIAPRVSYEEQWQELQTVATLSDALLDAMVEHLKYHVDEEGGPRMSCVVCVFKSILALATSATLPGAAPHFVRASGIEDHTGHYIKVARPLKAIVAQVPQPDASAS